MSIRLTQEEFNDLFKPYPQVRKARDGQPECPYCGNGFSPAGLNYWNSVTDAGTDFCDVEIECDICHIIIWRGGSWYPNIEDRNGLIEFTNKILESQIDDESNDGPAQESCLRLTYGKPIDGDEP